MTSERPDKWLCLQLDDSKELWYIPTSATCRHMLYLPDLHFYRRSSPFDIQEIGTTFTKIPKGDGSRYLLMQVSVAMKNATIFITFKRATQWPYVIVNNSSTDVTFYQEVSVVLLYSKHRKGLISIFYRFVVMLQRRAL